MHSNSRNIKNKNTYKHTITVHLKRLLSLFHHAQQQQIKINRPVTLCTVENNWLEYRMTDVWHV